MSARARIIIWEYTAERVLENPVLGIGADSTPAVKAKAVTAPEKPKGFVFRRTTGQHAHNLFLQSWYELGLFGTILVAIAGAAAALRLLLLPLEAQAYGAAAFTLFAVIAVSPGPCGRCGSSAPSGFCRSISSCRRRCSAAAAKEKVVPASR